MISVLQAAAIGLLLFANPTPTPAAAQPWGGQAEVHGALRDARTCAVTADGYAVGTASGLAILSAEGHVMDLVTPRDGLPGARVDALAQVGDQLWAGTEGGLARLERAGQGLQVRETEPGAPVRSLFAEGRGSGSVLWIGTWGEGVVRRDRAGRQTIVLANDAVSASARGPASRVTGFARHGDTLMVGTAAGLFELSTTDDAPELRRSSLREQGGLVHALLETPQGLWIHELSGSYRTTGSGPARRVGMHDVRDSTWDGERTWLATYDAGLVAEPDAPSTGPVLAVDAGRGRAAGRACAVGPDALWIKSGHASAWRRVQPGGLPSGDVAALLETDDGLWAGTFDRGLALRPAGSDDWRDVPGVDPEVNAIAEVPGVPGVFVGTANGLYHVRPGRGLGIKADVVDRFDVKSGLPSTRVQALAALDDGSLVVGTSRGIARLSHGRLSSVRGAQTWSVFALAAESDGSLWIGTTKGLVRLDPTGHKLYFSVLGGQLPDDWITALTFSPEGILFVGTYAAGVVRLRPGTGSSATRAWSRADSSALGGGRINIAGLTVRGGTLWAATMDTLHSTPVDAQGNDPWTRHPDATLCRDVTALVFAPGVAAPRFVAGRRGIVEYAKSRSSREP